MLAQRRGACTDPPNQSGVSILGDIVPEPSPCRHDYNEPLTTTKVLPGTVKMAGVHIKLINKEFGSLPLSAVRPSMVKAWTAKMKAEARSASYIYAVYRRLAQIMGDAVQDGIIPRSPCSRSVHELQCPFHGNSP